MARCTRIATKKVSLGGNDPKYACEKCAHKAKVFAKQFNAKIEVTEVETNEQCENNL